MSRHAKTIFVIFLLVFGLYTVFVREGFTHWFPQGELRSVNQTWKDGQYIASIKWFVIANTSALDAGWRHIFVKFYYQTIPDLIDQGKFDEALEDCVEAVKILNGYDDEGSLGFTCIQIEQAIKNNK